jgi:molybdopterin molybdotransferase
VIGMLATLGYPSFPAYENPSVAVMYTGNELIRPGKPLAPGQIYNSNSYALTAALESFGCTDLKVFHAKDTPASTKRALKAALNFADVIISTGGVSVGDYDYVKDIAEQMNIKTIFWKIALKPGKPVYFGVSTHTKHKQLIFGLPGNPVSALVTYHQLVKPALCKMTGRSPSAFITHAILTKSLHKRPGRMEFIRATAHDTNDQLHVTPLTGQDSHMMGGLAQANCLIHFPLEAEHIEAGTPAKIEFLSWQS